MSPGSRVLKHNGSVLGDVGVERLVGGDMVDVDRRSLGYGEVVEDT